MGAELWEVPVRSQGLGTLFVNTGTPKGLEGMWPTGFNEGLTQGSGFSEHRIR